MHYTLRSRAGITVTDAHQLMTRAHDLAAAEGLPTPCSVDSALALVLTDDTVGDVVMSPDAYGLTVTATSTLATREDLPPHPETWIDAPFGVVSGAPIAHYMDMDVLPAEQGAP